MKEDPLKRGGQHLTFVQNQINSLGFYPCWVTDTPSHYIFKKFKTVNAHVEYKLKERIKGI